MKVAGPAKRGTAPESNGLNRICSLGVIAALSFCRPFRFDLKRNERDVEEKGEWRRASTTENEAGDHRFCRPSC
jgi:hypothetical protein